MAPNSSNLHPHRFHIACNTKQANIRLKRVILCAICAGGSKPQVTSIFRNTDGYPRRTWVLQRLVGSGLEYQDFLLAGLTDSHQVYQVVHPGYNSQTKANRPVRLFLQSFAVMGLPIRGEPADRHFRRHRNRQHAWPFNPLTMSLDLHSDI